MTGAKAPFFVPAIASLAERAGRYWLWNISALWMEKRNNDY
nr:Hypothetical protein [Providencia rettgeri]